MTSKPIGFDFGRGPTTLDRFVRMVLTPSDSNDRHQDAQRFTPFAWQCAKEMCDNTKNPNGYLVYTGDTVIPQWLREVTHQASYLDPQMGGPTLMTAWPTNVDWFTLEAEHPSDIELSIDFDDAPRMTQVRQSVSLAREAGVDYRLGVQISPASASGEPLSVCLDQLDVRGVQRDSPIVASIIQALGGVAPEQSLEPREIDGIEGWSWEWMSYWPTGSPTSK